MPKSLEELIELIKKLPLVEHKGVAAIIGATVADAASRPLHWIYNQETLNGILFECNEPEFWHESKSPFYTLQLGCTSSYNDAAYVTLSSMNNNAGKIDIEKICEGFKVHFGPGTKYEDAFRRRKMQYDSKDRDAFPGPVEGPWIHKAVIAFLENYKNGKSLGGANINEMDGFCASLPIIAQNSGEVNLWEKVSKISALLTTNPEITKLFHVQTILLNQFIQGETEPDLKSKINLLYPELVDMLLEVERNKSNSFVETSAKFGKACSLPGSFKNAYLTILKCPSFVNAIRLNITAGGCTCSRANVIGSCLGAKDGIDSIPVQWLRKVIGIENIIEMTINVVSK